MKQLLSLIKRPLRVGIKYGITCLKGYPLYYSRVQQPNVDPHFSHLWASCETPIPQRGTPEVRANRIWNLQLAANRLHGLILQPGQIFSFWNRVPSPTVTNGFREGPVFVQGRVITDIGGGLCLVATNLFNTALAGGCEILERHGHSIDPYGDQRFFTLGQDASVAYGYKDMILRNWEKTTLKLAFEVLPEQGVVKSSLWGVDPYSMAVKIDSQILEELPPETTTGIPGWRVETTRWVCPKQILESSDLVNHWQITYRAVTVYKPCSG